MNTLNVMKFIAENSHHQILTDDFLNLIPDNIRTAILENNSSKLQIQHHNHFANETEVVRISAEYLKSHYAI